MNTQLSQARANNILSAVFEYKEGIMSRKEWLDLMFKDGYKLQGNTLYNNKGIETTLNATETAYFNKLLETYETDLIEVELHQKFKELEDKIESYVVEREDGAITLEISVGELIDLMRIDVLGHKLIHD